MSDHSSSRDLKQAVGGVREPVTAQELADAICMRWIDDNGVAIGALPTAVRVKMGITLFNIIVEVVAPPLRAATASPTERSALTRDDQKTASEPLPFDPDTTPQEA